MVVGLVDWLVTICVFLVIVLVGLYLFMCWLIDLCCLLGYFGCCLCFIWVFVWPVCLFMYC